MNEQINPVDKPAALHENFIGPPLPPEVQPDPEKPVRTSAKRKLITTLTLTSATCRWPFGDPAAPDFHYCGQLPQTAGPYCDTHDSMSRPSAQRRKSS
jgi:GcrA cell cycle regulator